MRADSLPRLRTMMHRTLAAACVLCAFAWCAAHAQGGAAEKPWYEQLTLHGSASASYLWNFNAPADGVNRYHAFDAVHNSFRIDLAEFILQHAVEAKGDAGFRADLIAGSSVPHMTASAGLLAGHDIDLKQAYISYIIPIGNGLRIDAGKYVTHFGYEVIEGYDGINDNMTRSFLFAYAIPYAHVGVRGSYAFSDVVSAQVGIVNGWDVAVDNNSSKTVTAQLGLKPGGGISLLFNGAYGPELPNDNHRNRATADVCAIWTASDRITIGLTGCVASEQGTADDGRDAAWSGVGGYLRWQVTDGFACALRAELFDDTDGIRTGTAQKLSSLTLTPEYRPAKNLVLRADLRMDSSNKKTFLSTSDPTDVQTIIGLNIMYLF